MKNLKLYIICILLSQFSSAQINEIGVFLGGANYIGDVGSTRYINPNEPAFGILYKWNRSKRHSFRFSATLANIKGNDTDSEAPNRTLRKFQFKNSIKEFSAGLEFNFLNFDLHESGPKFTPYIYSGLSTFIYDEIYISNNISELDYQYYSFSIPMVVGLKAKLSNQLIIGAEIGARTTFTDNLDGSNPKNENFKDIRFGNLNSKDWYVFSGFTLTYTFGKNPCFCAN